jgi:hypothetical protein
MRMLSFGELDSCGLNLDGVVEGCPFPIVSSFFYFCSSLFSFLFFFVPLFSFAAFSGTLFSWSTWDLSFLLI